MHLMITRMIPSPPRVDIAVDRFDGEAPMPPAQSKADDMSGAGKPASKLGSDGAMQQMPAGHHTEDGMPSQRQAFARPLQLLPTLAPDLGIILYSRAPTC